MKKLACLLLLAACELQPAPKQQPTSAAPAVPPEPTPPPMARPVEPPPTPTPTNAGSAAAEIAITPACLQVGAKIAQVFVDSAKDPVQHTIFEQERANMTRKTGAACTTQSWSDAARACYLATKTPADIKACEAKFTPPPPPPPPPPAKPVHEGAAPPPNAVKPDRPAMDDRRREPGTPATR